MLEQDIQIHKEKVQDVQDAAQVFRDAKHFMNKELQARAKDTSERYNNYTLEQWFHLIFLGGGNL